MTNRKLAIGELMEGALTLLFTRPIALGLFVLADASMAYGVLWAEARYDLGFALTIGLSMVSYSLISSFLILTLGERFAEVFADPSELFVRLVFVLAAGLVVVVGAGLGLVLLLVPGLYLLARWAIVSPLILLHGAGIRAALQRSWQLTEESSWALVAVSLIIYIPQALIGFFGASEAGGDPLQLSPGLAIELVAASCMVAFEVAVIVFASHELSTRADELSEIFA